MDYPDPTTDRLTQDEFEQLIEAAIQTADASGLEVERAMTVHNLRSETLDWTVEISAVWRSTHSAGSESD